MEILLQQKERWEVAYQRATVCHLQSELVNKIKNAEKRSFKSYKMKWSKKIRFSSQLNSRRRGTQ